MADPHLFTIAPYFHCHTRKGMYNYNISPFTFGDSEFVKVCLPPPMLDPNNFLQPPIPLKGSASQNKLRSRTRTPLFNMVFSIFGSSSSKRLKHEITTCTPLNDQWDDDFEIVDGGEAGSAHTRGWSLQADRHLVVLWFFTTHSFSFIANILNYSLDSEHKPPFRITKQIAKRRLQLLQSMTYDRAFVYHEFEKKHDWDPEIRQLDYRFLAAARTMRSIIEKEDHDWKQTGEQGKKRRWTAEQREELKAKKYRGLQRVAKGIRPEVLEDDYDSDISADGKF